MPFGLNNAPPSVFQSAIIKSLGDLAHCYDIVYMDWRKIFLEIENSIGWRFI